MICTHYGMPNITKFNMERPPPRGHRPSATAQAPPPRRSTWYGGETAPAQARGQRGANPSAAQTEGQTVRLRGERQGMGAAGAACS